MSKLTPAATDVLAERARQVNVEGWTHEHDDLNEDGAMASAAACYAAPALMPAYWPWDLEWWKPKSRRADLVRAGALILAEIERMDRRDAIGAAALPASAAPPQEVNPWVPMSRPIDLKHLGKLGEELAEAGAATSRCIIQGIDEREPVTGKPNRQWLEEELADVQANTELVCEHFDLDTASMERRRTRKKANLRIWHAMLAEPAAGEVA